MLFTVSRVRAHLILAQMLKTCNTKNKGTIEADFVFQIRDGKLYVTSFNGIAEQTSLIPVEKLDGQENEGFTVTAQPVVDFIKQFGDDTVNCAYMEDAGTFYIGSSAKKTKFAFPAGSIDDFVPLRFQPSSPAIVCAAAPLSRALRLSAFASTNDKSIAPLTSVRLEIDTVSGAVRTSASDRIRMSRCQVGEVTSDMLTEILLPRITAESLAAVLSEGVDVVTLEFDPRHVRLTYGDTVFTSLLEDTFGKSFPDLDRFLDAEVAAHAVVSRGDFLQSVKLSALVARGFALSVTLDENGIQLATSEQDKGASQVIVTTQSSEGTADLLVSCDFLQKAVEMISAPWITLHFVTLPRGDSIALMVTDGEGFGHFIFPTAPNQVEESGETSQENEEGEDE